MNEEEKEFIDASTSFIAATSSIGFVGVLIAVGGGGLM